VWHTVHMGDMRNAYKILVGNTELKKYLLGVRKILLKWTLKINTL